MPTTTVPAAKLAALPTAELIAQYDAAISTYRGRCTNASPGQKRIDRIVGLLEDRADAADAAALAWFAA